MNILNDLKTENHFAFGQLYQNNFNKIKHFVCRNNGSIEDAEDLFQEAMLVLVEKLRQDDFRLTASINTYVYAICKNLWLKKLRNANYTISLERLQNQDFQQSIEGAIDNERNYRDKLQHLITKITDHCQRLIHDMFFKDKAIEQIQQDYGYSSKHNAQNQKYKCLQQIKRAKENMK